MSFRHHLVRWEAEYADCGLKVIEVSGGRYAPFDFSKDKLAKWGVRHPVLWDRDNTNTRAYEIGGWSTAYLIGVDGKVFWQGNPGNLRGRKDEERAFRTALEAELAKVKPAGK